jgi:hypothetical protein
LQPGKVGDTQDDRTGIIMRPMMVGWGVTATKERERERDKHTDRLARVRSFSGEKLPQNATTTKREKKSKRGPQTEVHHYEAEMGIYFSSLYNAWHLHSRRSDVPVGAT